MFDVFHSVFDVFFFKFFICVKGEKNLFSILANSNTKFIFHKLKAESLLHMCVKFYFIPVLGTYKNVQLFIKLLKISFFAKFFFFASLKTRDIFLPSMKFTLNYHEQNFIDAFSKKMTVKYSFE